MNRKGFYFSGKEPIMQKKLLAALTPALSMLTLAAPAAATTFAAQENVVIVSYADLDLSRSTGEELLMKRLKFAATIACDKPLMRDLKAMNSFNACVAEAMAKAAEQMPETASRRSAELAAR